MKCQFDLLGCFYDHVGSHPKIQNKKINPFKYKINDYLLVSVSASTGVSVTDICGVTIFGASVDGIGSRSCQATKIINLKAL